MQIISDQVSLQVRIWSLTMRSEIGWLITTPIRSEKAILRELKRKPDKELYI
ncbi:hypothetical protein AA23498_0995 [Acetobacter nitrogenifigens DSM 23921 = NBRC 105050]|nr:hypothetical protein AA23498_0995 [Acetobacter nitrogenifigens DSM 23921 = NBRC 105050]